MSSAVASLFNHQKSDLLIALNNGLAFDCDMCNHTIKDCICFCNKCKKRLHLTCAGVEMGSYITHDGKKQIVLPAPEQLPKSCRECRRSTLDDRQGRSLGSSRAVNNRSPYDHQRSPTRVTARSISLSRMSRGAVTDHQGSPTQVSLRSVYRFLELTNQSAHQLSERKYDDFLIHRNMTGHKLDIMDHRTIYRCSGCKENGFGPHYACQSSSCSFRLHKDCESPRKSMTHPFFPRLNFAFSSSPTIKFCIHCRKEHSTVNCNACGMDVNGYFYQSHDNKKHLHACCANLPHKIICGESGATMELQPNTISRCFYCNKTSVMVDHKMTDQIWSYVSWDDNFHLHISCIIKMLSDLKDGSVGRRVIGCGSHQTLRKKSTENGMTKLDLQIVAAPDAKKKWEAMFRTISMKFAKMALGAIISTFLGPITPFISLLVELIPY